MDAFIIGVFQFAKEHSELGLDDYRTILAEHHIKPGVKSLAEAEVSGLDGCWTDYNPKCNSNKKGGQYAAQGVQ